MTRIILIKGSTDSHKTSSVLEFASGFVTGFSYIGTGPGNLGTSLSALPPIGVARPKDFVAVGNYTANGITLEIGVASAGDDEDQIEGHLSYFVALNLDIIVICSKTSGESVDKVMHHIYDPAGLFYKSTLNVTSTFRFAAASTLIREDQTRVVNDIRRYIG